MSQSPTGDGRLVGIANFKFHVEAEGSVLKFFVFFSNEWKGYAYCSFPINAAEHLREEVVCVFPADVVTSLP